MWRPFSDVKKQNIVYSGSPYLMKITGVGADGKELPKTSLGKLFGRDFDKVRGFEDTDRKVSGGFVVNGGYGGEFTDAIFFSPNELFEIDKPGTYTITLEIQVFEVVYEANKVSHRLIHFSPVKIEVEKPVKQQKESQ
jgi:hypothetical protein